MATEQNGGIRPSALYSLLSTVFLSMCLVLVAASKADDNWFRLFVLVYLVGMQLTFVVMTFVARRAEKRSETKPQADPGPAPDRQV
jgi:hypothetical protein